ncbi:MAG TPA: aminotransferase class V-fold PLP-dependent enzyme [Actinomycetales bacterium]|nr:aminotransferase class V-fold PLP-dependent enzyme [Actinomycetales bacterium]
MTTLGTADRLPIAEARALFRPVPGYLNAASLGLPPRTVADTLKAAVDEWSAGKASPTIYDQHVARSRELFAHLVKVPTTWVAVGSQVSVLAGTVAASLPDGAEVICVEGDFSSMVYPFMVHADRGVTVRHVPIEALAEAIRPQTTLVAFSLAQSACGSVVDADAVRQAAAAHGAVTFCDTTQAAGWMPVDARDDDITVCSAYKWLCAPRGSAFLTVSPDLAERLSLRPINAGWYAGDSVWDSCYGPDMHLAHDARRFDVSPAWLPWAGTVPALELFTALDMQAVRDWDSRLANALRVGLGLDPADRPVVSLPDPDGAKQVALSAAGAVVAGRAGRVRIAFHLWNDESDVELALNALTARH